MQQTISCSPPVWLREQLACWIGEREYCFRKDDSQSVTSVSFVSSSLARPLYKQQRWFATLKAQLQALGETTSQPPLIITTSKTTCDPFLRSYVNAHPVSLGRIRFCRTERQWKQQSGVTASLHSYECIISPPRSVLPPEYSQLIRLPERDRLLVGGADRVMAIHCEPQSKTAQLIAWRSKEIIHPCFSEINSAPSTPVLKHPIQPRTPTWIGSPLSLAHWTRAIDGPWPHQTESEWHNQLIQGNPLADHSAFSSLRSILSSEMIFGGNQTIRGGYNVVCLTAVPLDQWNDLRVYRPHLRRWDFCPFGILFSPRAVKALQPHRVHYGTEALWQSLTPSQRPFFQANDSKIDWSVECEYRVPGNLDISVFPSGDLVIFTETSKQASGLQQHCRWPVLPFDYLQELARIQS